MTRQQALDQIAIKAGDFVVDIGGGHRPFRRANLVVEKFPFADSLHRIGPMRFPAVPVIQADALVLPIPDGGCDLIFASHLIEHLSDPARFVSEIRRCSRKAYLEFPTRQREVMYAWSFHAWLVEAQGTVLKFYRNDLPQLFGPLFHEEYDAALGAWSAARHELMNCSVYCDAKDLRCEFPSHTATEWLLASSPSGDGKVNDSKVTHRPRYSVRENLAMMAQSLVPESFYARLARPKESASSPAPLPGSLLERLMCLACRGTHLRMDGGRVRCRCGAQYPLESGIVNFDLPARTHIPSINRPQAQVQ